MAWEAAVASALGAHMQNQANKKQARNQMAFQERMSNTSYQRGMADMRRAGLNPILAYKQGGASTPAGAMATMQNVGAAGVEGYSKMSSARQAQEQTKKISEEAKTIVQTRDFAKTLHEERWARQFATMSKENVLASVMAKLNGVDIKDLLGAYDINLTQRENLKSLLQMIQQNSSVINKEYEGAKDAAGKFFADLFNDFMASNEGKTR